VVTIRTSKEAEEAVAAAVIGATPTERSVHDRSRNDQSGVAPVAIRPADTVLYGLSRKKAQVHGAMRRQEQSE
jgi:hypothetical protein